MLNWIKGKFAEAAQAREERERAARQAQERWKKAEREQQELADQIETRFPSHRLYRVQQGILSNKFANMMGSMLNERVDFWLPILARFPHAPQSESQRIQGEARFWNDYVDHFTVKGANGEVDLQPKQNILDYFSNNEKWIFRRYYAATGIIKKTIAEDAMNITLVTQRMEQIYDESVKETKGSSNSNATIFNEIIQKTKEIKQFYGEKLPAYYLKEGEWFFFNIQEAFNKIHSPRDDYGPQSAVTLPLDGAQNDLSYKRNA